MYHLTSPPERSPPALIPTTDWFLLNKAIRLDNEELRHQIVILRSAYKKVYGVLTLEQLATLSLSP